MRTRAEGSRPDGSRPGGSRSGVSDGEGPLEELPDARWVDPAVLSGLLARYGWQRRGGVPGRYTRWTPPVGTRFADREVSLLVPHGGRWEDHGELLHEALTALARSGAPSAVRILRGLAVPGDEIRWMREVPRTAGTVSWEAAERLWTGVRAMLLAVAHADCPPHGYFGERHARYVAGVLSQVLVESSPGGRPLTVYAPVPQGRPLTTALLRSLNATRDAVDHRRATGSMEAFDSAVDRGVCRELTESLVRLVHGAALVEVSLSWSSAVGPPHGYPNRPPAVVFSPVDLPVLREAGVRYLHAEQSVAVRITGEVVALYRRSADGAGTVRLRVLAGADVEQVVAQLAGGRYRVAAHAHLAGVPVRVSGLLHGRGGFRRLTAVREVTPAPVDPQERERLSASVRGAAELVEELREQRG